MLGPVLGGGCRDYPLLLVPLGWLVYSVVEKLHLPISLVISEKKATKGKIVAEGETKTERNV